MSEKIKMLELASNKAANDGGFIAYLMKKYLEKVRKMFLETECFNTSLHCGRSSYKLNLCRVPDVNANDFVTRLNNISQYTNSSAIELNKIIKRANSIFKVKWKRC